MFALRLECAGMPSYIALQISGTNAFLRVDCSNVDGRTAERGTVACELGQSPFTTLILHAFDDGTLTLESALFPQMFLYIEGDRVIAHHTEGTVFRRHPLTSPAGTVVLVTSDGKSFLSFDAGNVTNIGGTIKVAAMSPNDGALVSGALTMAKIPDEPMLSGGEWPFAFEAQRFIATAMAHPNGPYPPVALTLRNSQIVVSQPDDTDAGQEWSVQCFGTNGEFTISTLVNKQRWYLSASQDWKRVELRPRDDRDGSQAWRTDGGGESFALMIGYGDHTRYLNASTKNGTVALDEAPLIGLSWAAVPVTVRASGDLPIWDIVRTVNLGDYLDKHQGNVIRLFADEVILDRSVARQADARHYAVDIRIDCRVFRCIGQRISLDVSAGTGPELGWTSYVPDQKTQPGTGQSGYRGGRFELNTMRLDLTECPMFLVLASGGVGGNGQKGWPGTDGVPGTPQPGATGGRGGTGGTGGDGGSVMVRAIGQQGSLRMLARGGNGGDGGKGGEGGRDGSNIGKSAPAGKDGDQGKRGADGTSAFSFIPANDQLLKFMDSDTVQFSLRERLHRVLTGALFDFASGKSIADVTLTINWAAGLAGSFADVRDRAKALLEQLRNANTDAGRAALAAHAFDVRSDSMRAALTQLHNVPAPVPEYQQSARFQATASPSDTLWSKLLDRVKAALPNDATLKPLSNYGFASPFVPLADAKAAAAVTPQDFGPPPPAEAKPLAVIAGVGVGIAIAIYIGVSWGASEEYQRQEAERKREEEREAQRKRDEYFKLLAQYLVRQVVRAKMDKDNEAMRHDDLTRRLERERQRRRDPNEPEAPLFQYGREYLVVLDRIDEIDEDPKNVIVTFDGVLLPRLDPVTAMISAVALRFGMTNILRVKLPRNTVPQERAWFVISIDPAGPATAEENDDDHMLNFMGYPYVEQVNGSLAMTWTVVYLGDQKVKVRTLVKVPKAFNSVIDSVLEVNMVEDRSADGPIVTGAPRRDFSTPQATIHNVGQALFQSFTDGSKTVTALDTGVPRSFNVQVLQTLAALQELANNQATIVLSHWDYDHYLGVTQVTVAKAIQDKCILLAPAFGLWTATAANIAKAFSTRGVDHLLLVVLNGADVPAFAKGKASLLKDLHDIDKFGNLQIPKNLELDTTEYDQHSSSKNNNSAICARLNLYPNGVANGPYFALFPGDASYSFISEKFRKSLTHIIATHHASQASVLTNVGKKRKKDDISDVDIPKYVPPPAQKLAPPGTVLLSYGHNSYGHNLAAVEQLYAGKGWAQALVTDTEGDIQIALT